jgi:hypothetical protein
MAIEDARVTFAVLRPFHNEASRIQQLAYDAAHAASAETSARAAHRLHVLDSLEAGDIDCETALDELSDDTVTVAGAR